MFGTILFWLSVGALAYHFAGYPLALAILARLRPAAATRPRDDAQLPKATLIISAYNEEEVLEQKIENAVGLNYPEGKLEVVVADEGGGERGGFAVGRRSVAEDPNRGNSHRALRPAAE